MRFLRSAPMLAGLSPERLEPLADRLQMRRYPDGARLFDEAPSRHQPLRILAHGHASWEPARSGEKRGAWMLQPGSVFGLATVNDWARQNQPERAWPDAETPQIRCRAMGPIWVLELDPARFDELFENEAAAALLDRLLSMYPTTINAPKIVAALREMPQFSRVSAKSLYRMLEHAPTLTFRPPAKAKPEAWDIKQDGPPEAEPEAQQPTIVSTGRALYYVLDGALQVEANGDLVRVGPDALGGADVFRTGDKVAPPTSTVETHAVMLDRHALIEMVRADPGFARSLGPHVRSTGGDK